MVKKEGIGSTISSAYRDATGQALVRFKLNHNVLVDEEGRKWRIKTMNKMPYKVKIRRIK